VYELCGAGALDDLRAVLGRFFSGLGIGQYVIVRMGGTVPGTAPLLVSNHHDCWKQLCRTQVTNASIRFMRGAPLFTLVP